MLLYKFTITWLSWISGNFNLYGKYDTSGVIQTGTWPVRLKFNWNASGVVTSVNGKMTFFPGQIAISVFSHKGTVVCFIYNLSLVYLTTYQG